MKAINGTALHSMCHRSIDDVLTADRVYTEKWGALQPIQDGNDHHDPRLFSRWWSCTEDLPEICLPTKDVAMEATIYQVNRTLRIAREALIQEIRNGEY